MIKPYKIYKSILVQALKELADKDYQERIWLNNGDKPTMTLSFVEAVNNVFDDALVKDALQADHIIFDERVTKALRELHAATDGVDETRPEEEIINDPLMDIVREKAARALFLINISAYEGSTVDIASPGQSARKY